VLLLPEQLQRIFDLIAVVLAIPVLLPATIGTAFLVRIWMGSPILFRQLRPGLDGRPFELIKFRTMNESQPLGSLAPDADRLTMFGRWLRSTSLDELPEFWNVFRGDISLVGPRPLLLEYLPLYDSRQRKRHMVRPGITGWAQVNGRNTISWEEKFELDVWYVENQSLLLDFKILLITVRNVLLRRDICSGKHATMRKFEGTSKTS
jgi:lipopolysaccharide/colanic/teichoic acid biosynthesis glycosyltransferase